ncbi:hypothetical protein WMF26_39060 [Sorangium sp. So ce185]|uniref:hypothetical protein n=1 Tax=Sorangium sp. So ce185 TaxID=3133287 RepID=UPI003F5EA065
MAGKRRHPTERAIIYGCVLGGLSNERINELLREINRRPLPKSSCESIRKHYVPYFEKDMRRLGAAIESPPAYSALKVAGDSGVPVNAELDADPADDE